MFQWDAVDTSLDWGGGQNVLKTFEIAIQHNRRTTRTELQRLIFTYLQNIFLPSYGGGGDRPHRLLYGPATDARFAYFIKRIRTHRAVVVVTKRQLDRPMLVEK